MSKKHKDGEPELSVLRDVKEAGGGRATLASDRPTEGTPTAQGLQVR